MFKQNGSESLFMVVQSFVVLLGHVGERVGSTHFDMLSSQKALFACAASIFKSSVLVNELKDGFCGLHVGVPLKIFSKVDKLSS